MKRTLCILCALALCLGLLPATALAATEVSYLAYSWDENTSTLTSTTGSVTDYTTVSSISSTTTWNNGWYVVSGNVSSTSDITITVSGNVNLILPAGSNLNLTYATISISTGSTLNIYGQADGSGTLTLGGNHRNANSGISLGSGRVLNIHGGTVNATGYTNTTSASAPGIDVGTGTLTVYGGNVTAKAGTSSSAGSSAGIRVTSGGTVAIHGGTVNATGASNRAASAAYPGAGIGGSGDSDSGETCGTVTITGGNVTATGGDGRNSGAAAGIGGGTSEIKRESGGGGTVPISGGTVAAKGGSYSTTANGTAHGIGGVAYPYTTQNYYSDAGTFSTGNNGSAVITTTGGIGHTGNKSSWQGIIDGIVYGNVTLPSSQYGKTLTVSSGANLTIPDGATLTGSITVESGGTLTVSGTVTNKGTITNNGTLAGGGTINNTGSGKVTNNGTSVTVTITYEPTVTLASDKDGNTAAPSQAVTFTATVTGNGDTPTGTVTFKDGETTLGTGDLDDTGKATYTTSTLGIGPHTITAAYNGDGSYSAKTSGELSFTVVGDVTSISIKTQPTNMTYTTGQALDLSGLVITLHYQGSDFTSDVAWSEDSGITSDPENGAELSVSQHNGQTITITYEGKTATTDALTVNKADQTGFDFTGKSPKTVTYGDEPFTVEAEGGEGTGDVTYTVTKGQDIVSIDGITVTIHKTGTAIITATKAADTDYNEATATLVVYVTPKQINGVYQIGTTDELFLFAALVNGTLESVEQNAANAVLTADIDLSGEAWTPIGSSSNPYTGTFDGAGYTISGMTIENAAGYSGLFGAVTGTVRDFTVTGTITITGSGTVSKVGGAVGSLGTASAAGTVSGVTSDVDITVSAGNDHIGGVVGSMPENSSPTVENCVYTGDINITVAAGSVAGIVGYIRTGTIQNCANQGGISVSGSGDGSVGGILGYCNNSKIYIRNCYNSGGIAAEGTANVGAIVGQNKSNQATVSNCYYLTGSAAKGQGQSGATGTVVKDNDDFTSGSVCWLLQNGQDAQAWGQTLGTDDYPVLTTDEAKRVYAAKLYNGTVVSDIYATTSGFNRPEGTNALCVIENAVSAPTGTNVIVKNGEAYTCANLVLTDGADFYTPVAFTATEATYTRQPKGYLQSPGDNNGWETLCLPFDGTLHVGNGDDAVPLQPATTSGAGGYWLRRYTAFTAPNTVCFDDESVAEGHMIKAGVPYLLLLPGAAFGSESLEGQTISVRGSGVTVSADAPKSVEYGMMRFTGAYVGTTPELFSYMLDNENGNEGTGSLFLPSTNRVNAPFRCRMDITGFNIGGTRTLAILPEYLVIGNGQTTGINMPTATGDLSVTAVDGRITLKTKAETQVRIYNLSGQLLWQGTVDGTITVPVKAGEAYIVNGRKVIP